MTERIFAAVLGALQAVGAAILVATPGALGLPDVAVAWVAVGMAGVGFLQMFTAPVHRG